MEKLNDEVFIDSEAANHLRTDLGWFKVGLQSPLDEVIDTIQDHPNALMSSVAQPVQSALAKVVLLRSQVLQYFDTLTSSVNTELQASAEESLTALLQAEEAFNSLAEAGFDALLQ